MVLDQPAAIFFVYSAMQIHAIDPRNSRFKNLKNTQTPHSKPSKRPNTIYYQI